MDRLLLLFRSGDQAAGEQGSEKRGECNAIDLGATFTQKYGVKEAPELKRINQILPGKKRGVGYGVGRVERSKPNYSEAGNCEHDDPSAVSGASCCALILGTHVKCPSL